VEWWQPRDLVLIDHLMLLPKSVAVRAANRAVNEAQRKAKEDRKKKQYEKQVRRDRGEDISNGEEEEGEEEGKIASDVDDIPWDDLASEDEPRDGGSSLW
jgi:hypothetical protein